MSTPTPTTTDMNATAIALSPPGKRVATPAVQKRVLCARFKPVISTYMFDEKLAWPKKAATPELVKWIAGVLGGEILRILMLPKSAT